MREINPTISTRRRRDERAVSGAGIQVSRARPIRRQLRDRPPGNVLQRSLAGVRSAPFPGTNTFHSEEDS
jgi:hypothetical protein